MKKQLFYMTLCGILLFTLIGLLFTPEDITKQDFTEAKQTTVSIEQDTIQLGEVRYGTKKQVTFRLTNTGHSPLLIQDIRTTCGCTGVKWTKRPLQPGKTREVDVTFEPNSLGKFIKNVEVYCNTEKEIINLKLAGTVFE